MILCNPSVEINKSWHDNIGRTIISELKINNEKWNIVNIYAPNEEKSRVEFYNMLNVHLASHLSSPSVIIGGDWNTCFEKIDRKPEREISSRATEGIELIMNSYRLSDV